MRAVMIAPLASLALVLCGCGSSDPSTSTSDTTSTTGTGGMTSTSTSVTTIVTTTTSTASGGGPTEQCLCIFDIDRTLTGKQQETDKCPNNLVKDGVLDLAYSDGTLTLSELAQDIEGSFCAMCYRGICSAGVAANKLTQEREILLAALGGPSFTVNSVWSDVALGVQSTLALNAVHGAKQTAVRSIVDWITSQGIAILDSNVHFFDDDPANVQTFVGTAFNVHEVSCGTRDTERGSDVGYCGGVVAEIVNTSGIHFCKDPLRVIA